MMKRTRNVLVLFLLLIIIQVQALALSDTLSILKMDIDMEIDPRMNRYTKLALEEATELDVDLVLVEMNTYGGAVNDADEIRSRFLDYDKPIYVFINNNAASAGALISISCDSIYMSSGASIGAATVVVGGSGEAAPDKYQSYMRSIMRSTAEAQGRDPKIAEAMVDENIDLDTLAPVGTVLTFSTLEAIEYNYCEGEVNSIKELLDTLGVEQYEIHEFKLAGTEKVIRFFLNPFISGILILIILGGVYFELQTPGVGFPIAAAIVAAVLYFVPYYLNGLAANWEIIVFGIGVIFLLIEIFAIPGFGVFGISGIILMVGSLVLVMVNNDWFDFTFVPEKELIQSATTAITAFLLSIVLLFVAGVKFTDSKLFGRIALQEEQKRSEGYTSSFYQEPLLGKEGIAHTVLRPSGKIMIDGEIYDAYTRGEYINKDDVVIVIDKSGTSLKVKAKEQ